MQLYFNPQASQSGLQVSSMNISADAKYAWQHNKNCWQIFMLETAHLGSSLCQDVSYTEMFSLPKDPTLKTLVSYMQITMQLKHWCSTTLLYGGHFTAVISLVNRIWDSLFKCIFKQPDTEQLPSGLEPIIDISDGEFLQSAVPEMEPFSRPIWLNYTFNLIDFYYEWIQYINTLAKG